MADPWAVQSVEPVTDQWAVVDVKPAKSVAKPKRSLVQDITGAMANVNRGLGIGDEMAAGAKTAVNIFSGKTPVQDVVPDFKRSMASQRATEDSYSAEHPHAAALARGTGMAATAAIPAGNTANLFAQGSKVANMARGATVAGLQGATYAAADRGTLKERALGAAAAARDPVSLGLGAVAGRFATPGAAKAAKPKINPDVVELRSRGVQLTPGQARGGVAKAAEDAMTSTPILGTAIQDARHAGLESYGSAAGNDALKSIGEVVPSNLPAGHQTVAHVEKRLGLAYDKTIPNRQVAQDPQFLAAVQQRVGDIAQDMTPAGRRRLAGILDQRVTSRFGKGAIDGETFQRINSELSTVKGRFSGSQDADQRAIAEAIGAMQEELRNAAARQDPGFAAKKAAVDKGYAIFKRMQSAAASPGAEGGVFTPAQYGGAVRRADKSVDKGASARGEAFGQDFADAGRAVLPNKTPDSGTATRGAYVMGASAPGAIIAATTTGGPVAGLGVAAGYGATLGGLKLASRAYSPEAIAAFNKTLDGKISRAQQQAALSQLKQLAINNPKVQKLYREAAIRLARVAGTERAGNIFAQPANP